MAKKVIVVRIGTRTIHIVHMENTVSTPTIYGCVRVPTPEGSVQDGLVTDVAEIARRIKKACSEKNIRTHDVIFTIESAKIASRETTIPSVKKDKVASVVMAKVPDLFPVDAEKYIFSHVLQGKETDDGEGGKIQDVRVFAAPADLIDSYYSLAEAAGLNIVAIEADGNSVFQLMKRQVKDGVSMALQINRDSTLVNIINGEKLLLQRVLPYGVSVFTEVMLQEEAFQVKDMDSALQILATQRVLLHHLNSENPTGDFSLGKRIEVTDNGSYLIENIGRVIEYYNSRYQDQPIREIICIGRGCSVAGLQELLTNELGIPAMMPKAIAGVRFNRKINIGAAILQYVNCFGAVFNPVNFVPRIVAEREARKGSLTASVLVFVGCLLVGVLLAGFSVFQVITATQDRDFWEARNNALAPVQDEFDTLTKLEANYALCHLLQDTIDTNNNHFDTLIRKISSLCPKSFRIQSISADEETITISGTSTDRLSSLSALKMQLEKIRDIQNVTINEISETRDALARRRQYSYTLVFEYTKEPAKEPTEEPIEAGEEVQ